MIQSYDHMITKCATVGLYNPTIPWEPKLKDSLYKYYCASLKLTN